MKILGHQGQNHWHHAAFALRFWCAHRVYSEAKEATVTLEFTANALDLEDTEGYAESTPVVNDHEWLVSYKWQLLQMEAKRVDVELYDVKLHVAFTIEERIRTLSEERAFFKELADTFYDSEGTSFQDLFTNEQITRLDEIKADADPYATNLFLEIYQGVKAAQAGECLNIVEFQSGLDAMAMVMRRSSSKE